MTHRNVPLTPEGRCRSLRRAAAASAWKQSLVGFRSWRVGAAAARAWKQIEDVRSATSRRRSGSPAKRSGNGMHGGLPRVRLGWRIDQAGRCRPRVRHRSRSRT